MSIVIQSPSGSATSSSYFFSSSINGLLNAIPGDYVIFSGYNSGSSWPLTGTSTMTLSITGSSNTSSVSFTSNSGSVLTIGTYLTGSYTGSLSGSVITTYALPATATPTPTPTPLPATATPTPTPTSTPLPATATPTPTPLPATATPTPTPLPATATPTPTPTPIPDCLRYITINVTTAGSITYRDCINIERGESVGTGVQNAGEGSTYCIKNNTLSGTAEFTIVGYGPACTPPATPTPTPTPLPATATPTPLPPTATPTAVPTATPTAVPTATPTPTPPTYKYLVNGTPAVSSTAACGAIKNIYLWSYSDTFIDLTTYYEGTITAPTIPLVVFAGGDRWKSNGASSVQIDDNGYATNLTACPTATPTPLPTATPTPTAVPTATPTPLPPTATPTAVPTATPTPVPTATPTPLPPTATPTAVPTATPTPTPQPQITVNIHTSQPSGYLACSGGTSIAVQLNGTTFCNTTVYTSSYFTGLGTNTFWLSYDGDYRQIFHTSGQNTATQSGACQACNNTPPTATPTPVPTATPTPLPPTATPTAVPTATPTPLPQYTYFRYTVDETTCAEVEIIEVWSYTYYGNGYYRIGGVLYYLSNEPTFNYTTEISGAVPSSCTPAPTPTPTPTPTPEPTATPTPSSTITWSLTDVTTGTANMQIYKNGNLIVNQSGNGNGSFTVTGSDVVYSTLYGTSPDFTYVDINDSVYGVVSDCNFNSAFVNTNPGYTYTTDASIDGVAINYIIECP